MYKITKIGAFILLMASLTGCMQLTGIKKMNAWGLEIESTQGFDISGGVMQYDGADNQKSMNLYNTKEPKGSKNDGRY